MNAPAPWWLPGGHAQTIWPAFFCSPGEPVPLFRRERWDTPDGDFIDVDFSPPPAMPARALLVLFHGLEGSSASHYARAFAAYAHANQLLFAMPHFRGCSGEVNRAPRAYHSGDFAEIDWILRRMRTLASGAVAGGQVVAVGVSLGGNALLRWAGELGQAAAQCVQAVAAVSAPLDLTASGQALGRGANRHLYTPMFLRSMKPRALQRLALHPGLFDRARLLAARNLYEFDDVFTGPLHGFKNAADYWLRASAKPHLPNVAVPALLLNAQNDPFIPTESLPQPHEVSAAVTLWQPPQGGHVGFASGAFPGVLQAMPSAVGGFLCKHLANPISHKAAVYG
jgi:uncharacterized protein